MKLARPFTRLLCTFTATHKSERVVTRNSVSLASIKELHAHLIRTQMHTDPFSISEVVKHYALSPPSSKKAHLVFNQIHRPTLLLWNYMIRGFSLSDQPSEAIRIYNCMYQRGLVGDNLTFISVFKACARVSDFKQGQKVHVYALKLGFESYLFVSNALIHMYACCRELDIAQKVFDKMPERDVVSWNSLICGFCQFNKFKEVVSLFESMLVQNVEVDSVTLMKVILACSYLSEWEVTDRIVKYINENDLVIDAYLGITLIDMYGRRGLVGQARKVFDQMRERNIVSYNAMIMAYAKVSNLDDARKLFDEMPERDVITWTSMITGYSQSLQHSKALRLFQEMMEAKVKPDEITVASVLSACAHLGSLEIGEAVHEYIRNSGIKEDVYVGNSLVDLYCKCGSAEKAIKVFHEMNTKDSVSWTSIISGLAVNGFVDYSIKLFSQMLEEGLRPTHGAFIGILLACAHAGLVDKGLEHFESMEKVHGLKPEMKHYGCVVDLLSRHGNLERAYEFVRKMPVTPDVVIWRILLSACKVHGDVVLAEIVSKKLFEMDPCNSGNYVLSSGMYAGSDRWDDVLKTRELMEQFNVQKPYAYSSVEVKGVKSRHRNNLLNSRLLQTL